MKVFITAGGTAGHLFPAIRLAEEIKLRLRGDVLFITSTRSQDREILMQKGIRFQTLPIIGFQSKSPLALLNFTVRLMTGTIKSIFLLLALRPSAVIGFGGYISGPIVLLASLFKIRTVIHEQNAYPGRTNRILARFVDRIAVSFPETREYLKKFESKIIVSGNFLRRGLDAMSKAGAQKDTFTILAMGGSQGSHTLNRVVPEAIGLMQADKKKALEVIHISGHKEKDEVIRAYQDRGIKSKVLSFTSEIARLYNESDFVISRAGATTVSELLHLAKPSILIPYPHANGHQLLNAKILKNAGIAILFDEQGLRPEGLRDAILRFMDRGALVTMSRRAKRAVSDSPCEIILKEIK